MKPHSSLLFIASFIICSIVNYMPAQAQQYKLQQSNTMVGMKTESTIYVKGMRKRTEGGAIAGMGTNLVTIEQCDLQRHVKINDKKKLYYIEPFSQGNMEIINEDAKTTAAVKNKPAASQTKPKNGGIITIWYTITDTNERKKMYGFNARHVWTYQKIKPSADACTMKDSLIIKTDGWYIDLPQFNCPEQFNGKTFTQNKIEQPDCKDQFITRHSGKGKLGFPLIEKRTIRMGDGKSTTSEFEMTIETLELSTLKLDSMLFEIPAGYKQTFNEEDLQDKFDVKEYMKSQSGKIGNEIEKDKPAVEESKKAGMIRVAVFPPTGEEGIKTSEMQNFMIRDLSVGNIEAIAVQTAADAKKYNCDYSLATEFIKIKPGSKVGGLMKAIKNTDPAAAVAFNIEATMQLSNLNDGTTKAQQNINGKYDGGIDAAAKKALDEGCKRILKTLQ